MEIFSDRLTRSFSSSFIPFCLKIFFMLPLKMWMEADKVENLCDICFPCNGFMVLVKGRKFASQKTFERGKPKVCILSLFNKKPEQRNFFITTENSDLIWPLDHKQDFIFMMVGSTGTCFSKHYQKPAKLL